MKTEERNKEVAHSLFKAIDDGNLDHVKALLSNDFKFYPPGSPNSVGAIELIQAIKDYYRAFPDNVHEIQDVLAEDNKVAVRVVEYATHKGKFEGVEATGKRVKNTAIHMGTFEGGKIKEWWYNEDALGLMLQLGMTLKP